jgi:hypothetical protein
LAKNPIAAEKILKPGENYKGLSYGNLIATWTNWLFSSGVDYSETTDILFLRGSVGVYESSTTSNIVYESTTTGKTAKTSAIKIQSSIATKFLNQTDENTRFIYQGTAIFVPVICAFYRIGDYYEGSRIEDEGGLRNAVFRTLEAGNNLWAKCKYRDDEETEGYPIIQDFKSYYMESPIFKLIVSERNKLKDELDEPFEAGVFDAVTGGYFLLLKNLPPGYYRIRFGGKGKGNYFTDAIYDIAISRGERQSIRGAWLFGDTPEKSRVIPKRNGFGI